MTDFATFARDHGLIVRHVVADGRVHRVPTEAHPRKRNGAYAFDGTRGFVQAWDVHAEAIPYRDNPEKPIARPVNRGQDERKAREAAMVEATAIVARSVAKSHPYLTSKGFPLAVGLVDPSDGRLVIPMYDATRYGYLTSVQRITDDGDKKFLTGGRAKDAVFHLGRGNSDVLVEGYATGLSVLAALRELYRKARVVVCFSASNLVGVARLYSGFVVADNDASKTGEQAAVKSGLPWVMPKDLGDANDLHQREGIRAVCALLRSA